jgi:hypothetical protein
MKLRIPFQYGEHAAGAVVEVDGDEAVRLKEHGATACVATEEEAAAALAAEQTKKPAK